MFKVLRTNYKGWGKPEKMTIVGRFDKKEEAEACLDRFAEINQPELIGNRINKTHLLVMDKNYNILRQFSIIK